MQKLTRSIGLVILIVLALPLRAHAATQYITPEIVSSSNQVEQALKQNKGRASLRLDGKGASLSLTYTASEPMKIYAVPLDKKGGYAPTDFLLFTLAAGEEESALIDLTVSPGWTPSDQTWKINALTEHEDVLAELLSVEFIPASLVQSATIIFTQLLTPEPYTPSTFHALRGYRIFATPVVPILGILTILIAVFLSICKKDRHGLPFFIVTVVCGSLLYQLRFSVDLLRFTKEHLTEYAAGTYDEAGSVYDIAQTVREIPSTSVLFVCRDGTNYKEKILRYMVYPMKVSAQAVDATHAVVMNKFDWSYDTVLTCGELQRPATRIADFPDGSALFSLTQL